MVKILSISQDKTNYKVVTTIGEFKFNEEVLVEYFIVKDKEFSNDEWDAILDYNDSNKFYLKALNYLSFKERTIFEMTEYLESKGMIDTTDLIDKLLDKGLLNDEVYANHFLEYAKNNLKGPRYVEVELRKRRVNHNLISEVLSHYTFEAEYDVCFRLFEKTVKPKEVSYNKYKKQLMDKFVRAGFGLNVINEVILNNNDLLRECAKEEASLLKDYQKIKHLPKDKVIQKLLQKGYHYSKIKDIFD